MPYTKCETSFVANTTMEVFTNSLGKQTMYRFTPLEGYVLHIKSSDDVVYDDNHENILHYTQRYCSGNASVGIDYDFSIVSSGVHTYTDDNGNTISIPFEKTGIEELYTLPADIVSSKNIY